MGTIEDPREKERTEREDRQEHESQLEDKQAQNSSDETEYKITDWASF